MLVGSGAGVAVACGVGVAAGPVLIVVPRAEGQDFAQQTAAARRLAAAAGLHEIPGDRPPGGGDPVFVAFARDVP